MIELFSYEFMQRALLGGIGIAIATALIGPFVVLRRLSLLGDGLAHLSFGGIALGLLLGYQPILVALVFAIAGSFFVKYLLRKNIFGEAAIALILSFGVGLGILITGIARGFNVDLFSYLIGSILTLSKIDLLLIGAVTIATVVFCSTCYRTMVFASFNKELAQMHNKKQILVDIAFTLLIALVVVIGIRAVGILLVSALLVTPTLVALLLSKSFKSTMMISMGVNLCSMIGGIVLAFVWDVPPSGTIVLLLFSLFMVTLVLSKKK